MSEQPYPPGTLCVITHVHSRERRIRLGDIVEVGEVTGLTGRAINGYRTNCPSGIPLGMLVQEINVPPDAGFMFAAHPVAWMLPKPPDDELDDIQREAILDSLRVDVGVVA